MVPILKLIVAHVAVAGVTGASWFQVHRLRAARPQVWAEVVKERDVTATLMGTGWARWRRETVLASPDNGRVRAVLVGRGEIVRKGQVLVVLDDQPLRLALERARGSVAIAAAEVRRAEADADRLWAQLELAGLAHRRTEQLVAAGTEADEAVVRSGHEARQAERAHAVAAEAVEAARANVRLAEADIFDAESRLLRHTVRAPLDGVVTDILVQEGQPVHGGSTQVPPSRLLALAAATVTDIEVPLDAGDAARLRSGARASVAVAALGVQGLEAQVVGVTDGDPGTGAGDLATVRVRLDAPPRGLRAGMSAVVHVTAVSKPNALAVPNHAVAGAAPGAAGVWTIRDGVIALVPIVPGLRGDFYSEVLAGVSPGMLVVTGPAAVVKTLAIGDRAVAMPALVRVP